MFLLFSARCIVKNKSLAGNSLAVACHLARIAIGLKLPIEDGGENHLHVVLRSYINIEPQEVRGVWGFVWWSSQTFHRGASLLDLMLSRLSRDLGYWDSRGMTGQTQIR